MADENKIFEKIELPIIGIVHSCFTEKFGIPRQPHLVPLARARIELLAPYNNPDAVEGLETTTHLWVQFVFHKNKREEWKPKVKPPRLGGNKTLGVFATRSPVRPSPIGLSVVKLDKICIESQQVILEISGVDILDGTPILDVKPYVPYADKIETAKNQFADRAPELFNVEFPDLVLDQIEKINFDNNPFIHSSTEFKDLIQQILQQDPRPQYQSADMEKDYAMELMEWDIIWSCIEKNGMPIMNVIAIKNKTINY